MLKRGLLVLAILILFSPIIQAQTIQVNYPSQVKVNEEFNFNLKLEGFSDDTYDIKIDINGDERISQIYNNGWKSTFNYVNDIISVSGGQGEGDFKMKIIKDFQGNARIDVKTRNSKESIKTFTNYTINIQGKLEEKASKETKKSEEETKEIINDNVIAVQDTETEEIPETIKEDETETIILEKDIKSYKSKSQSIKEYSIYGFTLFCIITLILLIIWQQKLKQ